jgi:hypothetical protein
MLLATFKFVKKLFALAPMPPVTINAPVVLLVAAVLLVILTAPLEVKPVSVPTDVMFG